MGKLIDLTGEKFGKLIVMERIFIENDKDVYWKCNCECGGIKITKSINLRKGFTTHCGCINNHIIHGRCKDRIYIIYRSMKDRCYNKNFRQYKNYGGRGIKICDEWLGENGFINFYNWATENGYSDELTIDRIDVNGDYEPSNCRWATWEIQSNNRRSNIFIEINDEIKTPSQWAKIAGISISTILRRYRNGIKGIDIISPIEHIEADYVSNIANINWDKHRNRWRVKLRHNGELYRVGDFKDLDEAIRKQEEFKNELIKHGKKIN